jgi:hypothetical protein
LSDIGFCIFHDQSLFGQYVPNEADILLGGPGGRNSQCGGQGFRFS